MEEIKLNAEKIRAAVGDLMLVSEGLNFDQVKANIDCTLSFPEMPDWLIEANVSAYRKRLAKNAIYDASYFTDIYQYEHSIDFFISFISKLKDIICDTALADDIVEEIIACTLLGLDGYGIELEKGFDYDHIHQVRLGVENGVLIFNDITNETPIVDVIKLRIQKQYDKIHPLSEEDSEEEEVSDESEKTED